MYFNNSLCIAATADLLFLLVLLMMDEVALDGQALTLKLWALDGHDVLKEGPDDSLLTDAEVDDSSCWEGHRVDAIT